jgi:hypothetical protein
MMVLNGRWCAVIRAVLPVLPLLLAGAAGAQPVYRCVDAAGKSAYQSEPCGLGARQNEVKLALDPSPSPSPAAARPSQWSGFKPAVEAVFTFYYDPAEEPVGYSAEAMEAAIRSAMQAWMTGCNVRLNYGGRSPARGPGTPDRVPIRWAPEYMQMAHPADARSGIAGSGSLHSGIKLRPRFHEVDMVSVLVHEMGHVFGLPHNHEDTRSVMSYLRDETTRRSARPNEVDFVACSLSVKKMFGTDYELPLDAAPPPRRMTDKDALERIHRWRERQ